MSQSNISSKNQDPGSIPPLYFSTVENLSTRAGVPISHYYDPEIGEALLTHFARNGLVNEYGFVGVPNWRDRFTVDTLHDELEFSDYLEKWSDEFRKKEYDYGPAFRGDVYKEILSDELRRSYDDEITLQEVDRNVNAEIERRGTDSFRREASWIITKSTLEEDFRIVTKGQLVRAISDQGYLTPAGDENDRSLDTQLIEKFTDELLKISDSRIDSGINIAIDGYISKNAQLGQEERIRTSISEGRILSQASLKSDTEFGRDLGSLCDSLAQEWEESHPTIAPLNRQSLRDTLHTVGFAVAERFHSPSEVHVVSLTDEEGNPLNFGGKTGMNVRKVGVDQKTGEVIDEDTTYQIDTQKDSERYLAEKLIASEFRAQGMNDTDASARASGVVVKLLRGDASDLMDVVLPGYKRFKGSIFLDRPNWQKGLLATTNEAKMRGKGEEFLWNAFAQTVGKNTGLWDENIKKVRRINWITGEFETKYEKKLYFKPWKRIYKSTRTLLGLTELGRWAIERNIANEVNKLTAQGSAFTLSESGNKVLRQGGLLGNRRYSLLNFNRDLIPTEAFKDALNNPKGWRASISAERVNAQKAALSDWQQLSTTLRKRRRNRRGEDEDDPSGLVSWFLRLGIELAWTFTKVTLRYVNASVGNPAGKVANKAMSVPWIRKLVGSVDTTARLTNLLVGKNLTAGVGLAIGGYFLGPSLGLTGVGGALWGFGAGTLGGKYGGLYGALGYAIGGLNGALIGLVLGRYGQALQDWGSSGGIDWSERQLSRVEVKDAAGNVLRDAKRNAITKFAGGPWARFVSNIFFTPLQKLGFIKYNVSYLPGYQSNLPTSRSALIKLNKLGSVNSTSLFRMPFKGPLAAWALAYFGALSGWAAVGWGIGLGAWEIAQPFMEHFGKELFLKQSMGWRKVLGGGVTGVSWMGSTMGLIGGFMGFFNPLFGLGPVYGALLGSLLGGILGAVVRKLGMFGVVRVAALGLDWDPRKWFKNSSNFQGFMFDLLMAYERLAVAAGFFFGLKVGWQAYQNARYAADLASNLRWHTGFKEAWNAFDSALSKFSPIGRFMTFVKGFITNLPFWQAKIAPTLSNISTAIKTAGTGAITAVGIWASTAWGAISTMAVYYWTLIVGSTAFALAAAVAATTLITAILAGALYLGAQEGRARALAANGPLIMDISANPYTCNTTIKKQDNGKVTLKYSITLTNVDSFQNIALIPTLESNTTIEGQGKVQQKTVNLMDGLTAETIKKNGFHARGPFPIKLLGDASGILLEADGEHRGYIKFSDEVADIPIDKDGVVSQTVKVILIKDVDKGKAVDNLKEEGGVVVGGEEKYDLSRGCSIYIGEVPVGIPNGLPNVGKVTTGAFLPGREFGHHEGGEIDISGPSGDNVYTTMGGRAFYKESRTKEGTLEGYGKYVMVISDKYVTLYAHLMAGEKQIVEAGDKGIVIGQGCRVGLEDSTGYSSGSHVHYEIRYNQVATITGFYTYKPFSGVSDRKDFFSFIRQKDLGGTEGGGLTKLIIKSTDLVPNPRSCF